MSHTIADRIIALEKIVEVSQGEMAKATARINELVARIKELEKFEKWHKLWMKRGQPGPTEALHEAEFRIRESCE